MPVQVTQSSVVSGEGETSECNRTFLAFGHQPRAPLHLGAPPLSVPVAALESPLDKVVATHVVPVVVDLVMMR